MKRYFINSYMWKCGNVEMFQNRPPLIDHIVDYLYYSILYLKYFVKYL